MRGFVTCHLHSLLSNCLLHLSSVSNYSDSHLITLAEGHCPCLITGVLLVRLLGLCFCSHFLAAVVSVGLIVIFCTRPTSGYEALDASGAIDIWLYTCLMKQRWLPYTTSYCQLDVISHLVFSAIHSKKKYLLETKQ